MPRWMARLTLWLTLGVLAACQALEPPPLPTLIPTQTLPTVVYWTAVAAGDVNPSPRGTPTSAPVLIPTVTPAGTGGAVPSPTVGAPPQGMAVPTATPLPWPTATPTAPPIPELGYTPYAPLQIFAPGEDSKVRSPIALDFAVQVRRVDRFQIELIGETGQLLYRRVMQTPEEAAEPVLTYRVKIPYEIRAEAEHGRLQLLAFDERGREAFRTSIHVILLRSGWAELLPGDVILSPIVIQDPRPGHLIQGGQVFVEGLAWPTNGMVEAALVTAAGKVLSFGTGTVSRPGESGYGTFSVAVAYDVSEATWVRLVVREYDTVPPGVRYLNSVEVLIAP